MRMRIAMVITFVELITVNHHFLIPMIVAQEVTIQKGLYERGLQKENLALFFRAECGPDSAQPEA